MDATPFGVGLASKIASQYGDREVAFAAGREGV
jgi:hypothetical protein